MIRNKLLNSLKSRYDTEKFDYVGIHNDEYGNSYLSFKTDNKNLAFKVVNKNCFKICPVKIISSSIYQEGFESQILKFDGKRTTLCSYIGGICLNEEKFNGRAFDFDIQLIIKRLEG